MLKRKSQIFCIAVGAIVCLFLSTDVLAEPEVIDIGGCEFTAEGPIVTTDCADPPCAVFQYTISNCSKSQFALALPDPETYCGEVEEGRWWEVLSASESDVFWPPTGGGDSDTKWYEEDDSMRVIEITKNVTSFYMVTTANVAAHPTPVLLKKGHKLYYGTTLGPSCTPPPPPPPAVAVSGVSTSTPEGCVLTVEQTSTGPLYSAYCPETDGSMTERDVSVHDTDGVYICFECDKNDSEVYVCDCDDPTEIDGKEFCCDNAKFQSDGSYGRVGQESIGWYYWNGKWYSYTY